MTDKLELSTLKEMLTPRKAKKLTEEMVEEINKLVTDPEYGEELAENYVSFIGILREKQRYSLDKYKRAIMYYTLVESGRTLVQSYIQVFPERVAYRKKMYPERVIKEDLAHEACRFNKSQLVQAIRQTDTISVKLVHRNLLHEAILKQAALMRTAKSELVQQKAAEILMRELKPEEDTNINVKIDDGTSTVLQNLRAATAALTQEQQLRITNGIPLKDIAESKIIQGEIVE